MIYLYAYLISCIPALLFFLSTILEDIQCYRGVRQPCPKFGYNWKFPWDQRLTPFACLAMLIPILNIYTGWYVGGWIVAIAISDWFKK